MECVLLNNIWRSRQDSGRKAGLGHARLGYMKKETHKLTTLTKWPQSNPPWGASVRPGVIVHAAVLLKAFL